MFVVIDPGHGGVDEGARGPRGSNEKTIVLDVAKRLATHLVRKGARTRLTRRDDRFVGLRRRAEMANGVRADALVSLHANSYSDPAVNGVETWVADRACAQSSAMRSRSLALARALQAAVVGATRARDRGVRSGNYVILRSCKIPAALVEMGFLTNPSTEKALSSARERERIARAMANAITGVLLKKAPAAKR